MRDLELWDPFRRLRRRWFSDFPALFDEGFPKELVREPLVDVVDRGRDIQVLVELPGIDKKDIEINVEEDSIDISAEQKQEAKEESKDKGYYFHERSYQKFCRRLPLPAEVIPDKSRAEMKNGVLEIILEKKSPTKSEKGHKVEVK